MASEIEYYGKRSHYPILIPITSSDLIPTDDLGRTVIQNGSGKGDWVKVIDDEGRSSYIPRCHLKENSQPVMNAITHVASLLYLLPLIDLIMNSFSSIL